MSERTVANPTVQVDGMNTAVRSVPAPHPPMRAARSRAPARPARAWRAGAALALAAAALAGCAVVPAGPVVQRVPAPAAQPVSVEVYAYPLRGQSTEQQRRDRYECHLWAVQQTGVEPSALTVSPGGTTRVYSGAPPGATMAGTAAGGAFIGAITSHPRHAAEGAIIGTLIGALIGSATEVAVAQDVDRRNEAIRQTEAQQRAAVEARAASYRRAMGACLEGRGYRIG